MGSVCCVAARDKTLPNRPGSEYLHRNIRYSPSWSFRWDSRTHIEDAIDHDVQLSYANTRNIRSGFKGRLDADIEAISDEGSSVENFITPTSQKSPVIEGASGNVRTGASDFSLESNVYSEERDFERLSAMTNVSSPKISISLPSTSSSMFKAEPSSSNSHSFPVVQTPPRRARHSPGYQLSSNDLTLGSHGGSSDGWSMRTFSELVASSQRERWSFDSENMSSSHGKITRSSSNSPRFTSPSMDLQACGICSKLLTERSSWSSQKIISSNELSVVAVLVCGHVYHADCLEDKTTVIDKYDPSCPLCTAGVKLTSKMLSRKASRSEADSKARNKISRIGIVDCDDVDGDAVANSQKMNQFDGKGPKMGSSSSMKSSFRKPFLRRHFSIGSKSTRVQEENECTRKKGFWARYRKE
ncbi:hypothetical protein AAC387_Pa10g1700 [Persea americana]|eukprot:TRINITY_DN1403_c0_g1_i2.p1 TRINITY_DN1403_c0_g1~~TRINITY_DN1403_c0_g1_i2.p1  ORF type:complete len:414 (+),score=87.58 TRINITY_DN1403_c0_g1_i2:351-1592(+)